MFYKSTHFKQVCQLLWSLIVAENDNSEACDSILQIDQLWVVVALSENFRVRSSKCRSDDKQRHEFEKNIPLLYYFTVTAVENVSVQFVF